MAAAGALRPVCPVHGLQSTTPGAQFRERLKVGGKLAIRIAAAAIEGPLLFAYLFYNVAAALRALSPGLELVGFGVFT